MPIARAIKPIIAGAAALASCAIVPSAGIAAPARVTPSCDAIPGVTEALGDRWRAFWGSNPSVEERRVTLLACRRGPGPAKRLLELGTQYATYTNCDCVSVEAIAGDRFLIRERFTSQYFSEASQHVADLATRRTAGVGERDWLDFRMLPSGAFVWKAFNKTPEGLVATHTAVEDARGVRAVDGEPLADIAVSATGAAYGTRPDGSAVELEAQGAAPLTWSRVPTIDVVPNRVRVARGGTSPRLLAALDGSVLSEVVQGRGSERQRVLDYGVGRVKVRPTGGPIRVLTMSRGAAVVEAPFMGSRGRTVRRLDLYREAAAQPRTRLPLSAPVAPGAVIAGPDGLVAVATGEAVEMIAPRRVRFALPGATDVAVTQIVDGFKDSIRERIYVTDSAGKAQTFLTPARRR